MAKRTIHMVFSKDTKRTRVYVEDTVGVMPIISTVYVEKWFVGEAMELEITVNTTPSNPEIHLRPHIDMESPDARPPDPPD